MKSAMLTIVVKWREVKDYIRPEERRMVEGGNVESVAARTERKVLSKRDPPQSGEECGRVNVK
jgi:hypothetical protein